MANLFDLVMKLLWQADEKPDLMEHQEQIEQSEFVLSTASTKRLSCGIIPKIPHFFPKTFLRQNLFVGKLVRHRQLQTLFTTTEIVFQVRGELRF